MHKLNLSDEWYRSIDKAEADEVLAAGPFNPKRVSFLFAWYDLWIGFYWDRKARKLYFLPIPCFGIVIQF